jgi:hypothetical protein
MDDEVDSDDVDEVEVERAVNDEIDDLLTSIPPAVNPDISLCYLKSRGDPDAINRDINCRNYSRYADLKTVCPFLVCEKNRASVDNNLQEKLDLEDVVLFEDSSCMNW